MTRAAAVFMVIWLVLVMMVVGVRAAARQQETPPQVAILLPNDACPYPCWQGIQPGAARPNEAHDILASLPTARPDLREGEWLFSADGIHQHHVRVNLLETQIYLEPSGVRLGDLLAEYGQPAYLWWVVSHTDYRILVDLYYPDQKMVIVMWMDVDERLSPHTPVHALSLSARYEPPPATVRTGWCGYQSIQLC